MTDEKPSERLISLRGQNRLTESISRVNSDKIVVVHERYHTPKYDDSGEYLAWKRSIQYVRSDGELVVHQHTESYHAHENSMVSVGRSPYSHTFELADDNETVVHDGRTWDEYAKERSRELTNTRWWELRDGKPTAKDAKQAVKEAIEANL